MKGGRNISIKNKLVIIQLFTSLIVLGLFVTAFLILDIRGYKRRRIETLQGLAEVIGTNAASTLQFQDNEAARLILKNLIQVSPRIASAVIYDRNGKTFASYQRTDRVHVPIPKNVSTSGALTVNKHLFVYRNIMGPDGVVGSIVVESELIDLYSLNREKYIVTAILVCFAILLSLIIAWIIQSFISRRLVNLSNTMQTATETGDYNTMINDEGKDEIGILSQSFNRLMAQVRENQRRKDEFIAVASHELKTPLTSIKGYIEFFKLLTTNDQNKTVINKALANVEKLERLIKDLLDVSKIQSGQLELTLEEFDICELITETIGSWELLSPHHRIRFNGIKGKCLIRADKNRIEQVFMNLISNAIKYSPGESEVIVTISNSAKETVITVRDFGIGIPEGEEEAIFERFYRTANVTEHISGFGLGLYICKNIVGKHGGRIWVHKESKGCTFHVAFPLVTDSSPIKNKLSSKYN